MIDRIKANSEAAIAAATYNPATGRQKTTNPRSEIEIRTRWMRPTETLWYLDGNQVSEQEIREVVQPRGCLDCALAIPDIHSATRAAQALIRGY